MSKLTNEDKHFGPITYGLTSGWRPFRIILSSAGDDEDDKQCKLIVYMFGYVFRIYLGNLIKPIKYKVKANWTPETIERMGRDWYYEYFKKEYGFSYNEGFLQIFYGIQNDDGHYTHIDNEGYVTYSPRDSTKTYKRIKKNDWSLHLPWTQYRLTSITYFKNINDIFYNIKDNSGIKGMKYLEEKEKCPTISFKLKDYDNEIIIAKTMLEERVYKRGENKFKWVSLFSKDLIIRTLIINFDKETGPEKGSWKGGTIGTAIKIDKNISHEEGMKQYCLEEHRSKSGKYKMEFIERID